jgi:uncharacterized protein YndB with AHSA1/START domain
VNEVHSALPYLAPLRLSVVLDCPPDQAFRAFTDQIGAWWPLATHSVGRERAQTCRFDPAGPGGRLIEIVADGTLHVWAEVAAWEPPHRLVLRWHPGQSPERAQAVEIRFGPEGGGTRVALEHRDWRQTTEDAKRRENYQGGWQSVLESRFAAWLRANEAAWRQGAGR